MEILKIFELPDGDFSLITWNGEIASNWDHKLSSLRWYLREYLRSGVYNPPNNPEWEAYEEIETPHPYAREVLILHDDGRMEVHPDILNDMGQLTCLIVGSLGGLIALHYAGFEGVVHG